VRELVSTAARCASLLDHRITPTAARCASLLGHRRGEYVRGMRWLARGEHEIPNSAEWLSPREAAWIPRLRYTKRRTEFLLRRWAGKHAVAAAAGLPTDPESLARIEIGNRESGAPFVLVDGEALGLDITLSDRAGWAVSLVGTAFGRLGIDLEIAEPRSEGFVSDFLTTSEQEYVGSPAALAEHGLDPDAAANLLWSAKESALKVLQVGLRRDTRSVEVTVLSATQSRQAPASREPGWGRLEVRSVQGQLFPGWWRRDGVFLLTMTAEEPFQPPALLPGSVDLATATPVHSWVHRPLADG
jgi:4'-phosphopantetheinyl transferase